MMIFFIVHKAYELWFKQILQSGALMRSFEPSRPSRPRG